jgi:hypothetical protein
MKRAKASRLWTKTRRTHTNQPKNRHRQCSHIIRQVVQRCRENYLVVWHTPEHHVWNVSCPPELKHAARAPNHPVSWFLSRKCRSYQLYESNPSASNILSVRLMMRRPQAQRGVMHESNQAGIAGIPSHQVVFGEIQHTGVVFNLCRGVHPHRLIRWRPRLSIHVIIYVSEKGYRGHRLRHSHQILAIHVNYPARCSFDIT